MASMGYCLIENTTKDLEGAVDKVREHLEDGTKLSASEYQYLQRMLDSAIELADLNEEHDGFEGLKP